VDDVLAMVGLARFRDQYATRLSGGQQQRVALARALIFNPRLLLFDEPLSNLDAKLREQLRGEIVRVQREVGITAIYVTHDQAEAIVISDQIIVMNHGRIEQRGDARTIYTRPANRFVAEFIGLANLIPAEVIGAAEDGSVALAVTLGGSAHVPLQALAPQVALRAGTNVLVSIRPEDVEIGPWQERAGENHVHGTVTGAVYMGSYVDSHVDAGGVPVRVQARADSPFRPGDHVSLTLPPPACICIPEE
jgi:iron(III) transport system ATP-binding protein